MVDGSQRALTPREPLKHHNAWLASRGGISPELVDQTGWIRLTVEEKETLHVDLHSKPHRMGTHKAEFWNNCSLLIAILRWADITVIKDWEKAAQLQ